MTTTVEYWVSIGLADMDGKPAYAGNIDEMMCAFVTGRPSEYERKGYEIGLAAHAEFVSPHLEDVHEFFEDFMTDEGHWFPYELDMTDTNRLMVKIGDGWTEPEVRHMLKNLLALVRGVPVGYDDGIFAGKYQVTDFQCRRQTRVVQQETVDFEI